MGPAFWTCLLEQLLEGNKSCTGTLFAQAPAREKERERERERDGCTSRDNAFRNRAHEGIVLLGLAMTWLKAQGEKGSDTW